MVSIENGSYRLTSITQCPPGKLKLVFDLGTVDHPVFGKASQLYGEVPLFQRKEEITLSNYFEMTQEEQTKILDDAIKRLRYILDNLDEEELNKYIQANILAACSCFPIIDVRTIRFELALLCIIAGSMGDDLEDDFKFLLEDVGETNRLLIDKVDLDWKAFKASQDSLDSRLKGFTGLIRANETEKNQRIFAEIMAKMKEEFPEGYPDDVKHCIPQAIGILQCQTLRYRTDDPMPLSEDMQKILRGYDAGFGPCAEFTIIFLRLSIPKKIRKSLMFNLLTTAVMDFAGLLNDVLGILKDVKEEALRENYILRCVTREGTPLQQAFNDAFKRLRNLISDIEILMYRLLEAFPEEKGLRAYIQACKDVCDGQTISYVVGAQSTKRYGGTLKIVPMETVG